MVGSEDALRQTIQVIAKGSAVKVEAVQEYLLTLYNLPALIFGEHDTGADPAEPAAPALGVSLSSIRSSPLMKRSHGADGAGEEGDEQDESDGAEDYEAGHEPDAPLEDSTDDGMEARRSARKTPGAAAESAATPVKRQRRR